MAWIRIIPREEAGEPLRREYEEAERRAGRVFNIVAIMSQNPAAMKASMGLYLTLMYGPSPLSRAQREMLAVVVSVANDCHY